MSPGYGFETFKILQIEPMNPKALWKLPGFLFILTVGFLFYFWTAVNGI